MSGGYIRGAIGKRFGAAKKALAAAIEAGDKDAVLAQQRILEQVAAKTPLKRHPNAQLALCAAFLTNIQSNDTSEEFYQTLQGVSLRSHILRRDPEEMKRWGELLLKLIKTAHFDYFHKPDHTLQGISGVLYFAAEAGLGVEARKLADECLNVTNEPAIMEARAPFEAFLERAGRTYTKEEASKLYSFFLLSPIKDQWRHTLSGSTTENAEFYQGKFTDLYATLFSMYGADAASGLEEVCMETARDFSTVAPVKEKLVAHMRGLIEKPPAVRSGPASKTGTRSVNVPR